MSGSYFPPDPCTCMKEEHSIIMTAANLGVADPARSTRPGGKAPATYIIAVSGVCRPVRLEIADLDGPVSWRLCPLSCLREKRRSYTVEVVTHVAGPAGLDGDSSRGGWGKCSRAVSITIAGRK